MKLGYGLFVECMCMLQRKQRVRWCSLWPTLVFSITFSDIGGDLSSQSQESWALDHLCTSLQQSWGCAGCPSLQTAVLEGRGMKRQYFL